MTKVKPAKRRAPSLHSRAARRETSPGIDTDKSLKTARLPAESVNSRPAVLAHHGGGVAKKVKAGRKSVLSSKARKRQAKAMDRAEAVIEKSLGKIERSKGQGRTLQSRKKTWDEVNKQLNGRDAPRTKDMVSRGQDNESDQVTDEDMDPPEDQPSEQDGPLEATTAAPGGEIEDEIL